MSDSSQDTENSRLADSGYASIANSPDPKDPKTRDDPHDSNLCHSRITSKTPPSSIFGGLKRFEKDVDEATLHRFNDVVERVQGPLVQYMRKRYKLHEFQPMAIRLMVVGETYETAKAQMVVFCPGDKTKRVKKFFAQRLIVAICRPDDLSQTSFNVVVIGQPPRPKNAGPSLEVYGASNQPALEGWASSSTLIKVTEEDGNRYATMGGIIKITKFNNEFVLCGLTAGHIFESSCRVGGQEDNTPLCDHSSSSEFSSDEEDDSDAEMVDSSLANESTNAPRNAYTFGNIKSDTQWSKLGLIRPQRHEHHDRDWALVQDISKAFQRPNTIQKMGPNHLRESERPLTLATTWNGSAKGEKSAQISNEVHIMESSSLHGGSTRAGRLSKLPTVALLPSGTRFVPVYSISLDGDSDLSNGSSGSWVVDGSTCEVYGHVVADDPFGDVFVVPFKDTLQEIKVALCAKEVTLASVTDILFSNLTQKPSQGEPTNVSSLQGWPWSNISSQNRQNLGCAAEYAKELPSFTGSLLSGGLMTPRHSPPGGITTTNFDFDSFAHTPNSTPMKTPHGISLHPKTNVPPRPVYRPLGSWKGLEQSPTQYAAPSNDVSKSEYASILSAPSRSSSSPIMAPMSLSNYITGYVRGSSPLGGLFKPFGGHLSNEVGSQAYTGTYQSPPSTILRDTRGSSFAAMPEPVFSNINNPSGQLGIPGLHTPQSMASTAYLPGRAVALDTFTRLATPDDRPFKCDQCPQSFHRNHDLKRHKRIHLAVKPFPCEHCNKNFSRKDALRRHVLVKGCGYKPLSSKPDEKVKAKDESVEVQIATGEGQSTVY